MPLFAWPEVVVFVKTPCDYERDTIAYAIERFFAHATFLCHDLAKESWQFRIAKGKKNKMRSIDFLFPACLMELPGSWIRIRGYIDSVGVCVNRVDLLDNLPKMQ